METLTDLQAIKKFFLDGVPASQALMEIKRLTTEDRAELGELCRKHFGAEKAIT